MVSRILFFMITALLMLSVQLPAEDSLRLNQIQVKGTHNSYHKKKRIRLSSSYNYQHPKLAKQLELGARQLELDLHFNNFNRKLYVHHVKIIDQKTHCKKFLKCLKNIHEWTQKNTDHSPLLIWLELKDKDYDRFSPRWGKVRKHFNILEKNILSVFSREQILVPDEVRGNFLTMSQAIKKSGWPLLKDIKGKVIFAFISEGVDRKDYLKGSPNLEDKLIWVEGTALSDSYAGLFKGGEYFNTNILKKNNRKIKKILQEYDLLYLDLYTERAEVSYLKGNAFFVDKMFEGLENIDPLVWDTMTKLESLFASRKGSSIVRSGFILTTTVDSAGKNDKQNKESSERIIATGAQFLSSDFIQPFKRKLKVCENGKCRKVPQHYWFNFP
jgi:hypothetical protein